MLLLFKSLLSKKGGGFAKRTIALNVLHYSKKIKAFHLSSHLIRIFEVTHGWVFHSPSTQKKAPVVNQISNCLGHKKSRLNQTLVTDCAGCICSLKNMFSSFQFKENLIYFQQLLGEGVFDISLLGKKPEEWKTLKRLVLSNMSKSKWVEQYNFLKVCNDWLLRY